MRIIQKRIKQTDIKKENKYLPEKFVLSGFLIILANSGYLLAFADASLFYLANMLLHVLIGLLVFIPSIIYGAKFLRQNLPSGKEAARFRGHAGFGILIIGMGLGVYIAIVGITNSNRWLLNLHIGACFIGVVLFIMAIRRVGHWLSAENIFNSAGRYLLTFTAFSVCFVVLVYGTDMMWSDDKEAINNPHSAPSTMAEEAMNGKEGPFFPSSAATASGKITSTNFLMSSQTCGTVGCHPDIYQQWTSSTHRYSAFNNMWYRKSIAQIPENISAKTGKWCAGCHSPALLISGLGNQPFAEQVKTQQAHTGISCNACHAITEVKSTMGNASYVLDRPRLLNLATSKNSIMRKIYDLFVHLDPEPHNRSFLKPFHSKNSGEFCSSCHKAHVDRPINNSHWLQFMNDYDSWQNSSFSGKGALNPHSVSKEKNCVNCHMPLVRSNDAANKNGKIHDHRFIAANTLIPAIKGHQSQLQATESFLADSKISVNIFAINPSPGPIDSAVVYEVNKNPTVSRMEDKIYSATTIANYEEPWLKYNGRLQHRFKNKIIAPVSKMNVVVQPGSSIRVDVVVRSRKIGHSFPAGAADMSEAWLELQAIDHHGKTIFWSGAVHNETVDPNAHFYGTVLVDDAGKRTYHYESWKASSAAYVNLLPPNSAEVVRYHIPIPIDCGKEIRLTAKLNYRKFKPAYAHWLSQNSKRHSESKKPAFDKFAVEKLPIITMARSAATLHVGNNDHLATAKKIHFSKHREAASWYDYGLGLLRQNDLISAEKAFRRASKLLPGDADIWINLGIVRLRSQRVKEAKTALNRALSLNSESARAYYYLGMAEKAEKKYKRALAAIKKAKDIKRWDRELLIEIGRLYYHREDYRRSIRSFKRTLRIDPENPAVYYYMMHTYEAEEKFNSSIRVKKQFLRFRKPGSVNKLDADRRHNPSLDVPPHLYHEHQSAQPKFWPINNKQTPYESTKKQ